MNIENNNKRVMLTPKNSSTYITSYTDGENILEYDGSSSIRLPVNADKSKYRVISESAHLEYERQKEEALEQKMERSLPDGAI